MKEFNLEEAKAGKPVCTKVGEPVTKYLNIYRGKKEGTYEIGSMLYDTSFEALEASEYDNYITTAKVTFNVR